jgi:hypothetical protein
MKSDAYRCAPLNVLYVHPFDIVQYVRIKNYGSEVMLYDITFSMKITPLNQKLQEYTGTQQ